MKNSSKTNLIWNSFLYCLLLLFVCMNCTGCSNDILDPTQIGRFRPVPVVNVILESLGVGNEPVSPYAGAEEPRPEDVVAFEQDYLVMGANGILCMYPEKYFKEIVLAGAPGMAAPDEAVAFERLSFALASKVELDRQGRLLLGEKLRKRVKLANSLTLVGVRDHIELWNSQDWEKYLSDNLSQYQNQVMQARQAVLQKQTREEL